MTHYEDRLLALRDKGEWTAFAHNTAPLVAAAIRAAREFEQKLEAIHRDDRYQAVWASYQNHGGVYTEPTYTAELGAVRAALAALDAQEGA